MCERRARLSCAHAAARAGRGPARTAWCGQARQCPFEAVSPENACHSVCKRKDSRVIASLNLPEAPGSKLLLRSMQLFPRKNRAPVRTARVKTGRCGSGAEEC